MYFLQNRWKLEDNKLVYYGLRNRENMLSNVLRVSKAQRRILESLPKELSENELSTLGQLVGTQVVTQELLRMIPTSIREARFCTECCANDYILPGLEFDSQGLCPMCQTAAQTANLKSIVPLITEIPRAKHSRFDAALFYTGGKDSTFLLYYLAKVKKLRILALTWEIPFLSESAKKSIEGAKKHFSNVEFLSRFVSQEDLRTVYRKLYSLSENTCACPSLAYVLFYPELVSNRIPFFLAGNEPVQMLGLYYNGMAPKIAYSFADNRFLQVLVNAGRLLTLRPPLKRGQFHTLSTMKQLAFGEGPIQRIAGYHNELVSNIVTAIAEVPSLTAPLKRSIRQSSRTGNIPAFVHLDFDTISGGVYHWKQIKDILVNECGWHAPDDQGKALHTSCTIERCKEHSQFVRYYNCKSRMIPFSALEISLASRGKQLSREEAIYEMENILGFSLERIPECSIMTDFLEEH